MTLRVPYIPDAAIERDAEVLIDEFARARGIEIRPPIPIEDIVEKHLKLHVEFDDMYECLGIRRRSSVIYPDIFGAIWLESGRIVIDQSLDPEVRPNREGTYRFTLAHEGGGHWRLHRPLIRSIQDKDSQPTETTPPTVVCRSSRAKSRVEWQANSYASCLLMPRKLVFDAWDDFFPDRKQRVLRPATSIKHRFAEISHDFDGDEDRALNNFARPFAERFLVSAVAMRIRLEKLGLLHRAVPRQRRLTEIF